MAESPRLSFPYIVSSNILDALVQPVVEDVHASAPPANPAAGALYVVGASAGGNWAGKEKCLAQYIGETWAFYVPFEGLTVWDKTSQKQWYYTGSQWSETKAELHFGRTDNPHATTAAQTGAIPLNHPASAIAGFAGSGAATTVARSDHNHSGAYAPAVHALTAHPASGLTAGHFLKATDATTFGFAAHGLTATDVGAMSATPWTLGEDATTLLQNYLNSGNTIFLPPGTYIVTNIVVPAGVTVYCASNVIIQRKSAATGVLISMYAGSRWYGGEVDGNKANCPSSEHGIAPAEWATDIMVAGVEVYNCKGIGIALANNSIYEIGANKVHDCDNQGIVLGMSSNGMVCGNRVWNCLSGISWWGGENLETTVRGISDIIISDNIVWDISGGGIWGSLGSRITVSENIVKNCGDVGIDFEGCSASTASDNKVYDCLYGGITYFYGSHNCRADNNTVIQSAGMGPCIKIFGTSLSTRLSFTGNTLTHNGSQACFYTDDETLDNFVFEDNDLYAEHGPAMHITDSVAGGTINNNRITVANGSVGIRGIGGNFLDLKENTIIALNDTATSLTVEGGVGGIYLAWRSATHPSKYCEVSGNTIRGFFAGIYDDCWGDNASFNAIRNNRVNTIYHRGTSGWTGIATGNINNATTTVSATTY